MLFEKTTEINSLGAAVTEQQRQHQAIHILYIINTNLLHFNLVSVCKNSKNPENQ